MSVGTAAQSAARPAGALDAERGAAGAGGLPPGFGVDVADAALALARRFAHGGTLWCFAPAWPAHAHHVAVEFVHPVVVGTRALPAVAVSAEAGVAGLRTLCRAGDALVVVASSEEPAARRALARAPAWGLTTIWIGAGPRPAPGAADHVLWWEGEVPSQAAHTGRFVLSYHLLWELTHVCFEHPGLLEEPQVCSGPACVTCGDEGRLVEVLRLGEGGAVLVRAATGLEWADASLVEGVSPGSLVLVHAGSVLTVLAEGSGE